VDGEANGRLGASFAADGSCVLGFGCLICICIFLCLLSSSPVWLCILGLVGWSHRIAGFEALSYAHLHGGEKKLLIPRLGGGSVELVYR